jgi:hypothetical protein
VQVERRGRMRVVERFTAVVARLRLGPQVCAGWSGGVGVRVRCLGSWRPCCGGWPGAMYADQSPRRTHRCSGRGEPRR